MSDEKLEIAVAEILRVLSDADILNIWLFALAVFGGVFVVNKVITFFSELPPIQMTLPEIPTRKVISFREGIYKKNSNTLTCSCCSARYDMSDIKIKFDQQGYFDCQCGAELCRLVVERVL